MMSPKQTSEDRGSPQFRHTPLQIIHILGNFLRIWSVYSMYRYLTQTGASVVLFIFCCLVPATIIFLLLQKPWKGRPLSNTQVVPSLINGAITAFYFVLWGKGLRLCGPLSLLFVSLMVLPLWIMKKLEPFLKEGSYILKILSTAITLALMAEYSGAVLGVLSAVLYGQRQHVWKKVGGLVAMVASFYLLSQGWAMASYFPIKFGESPDTDVQTEHNLGIKEMILPISAGILSALRRVITRRVSLKNQYKRRLHAITVASATCFLFPVAMWDMILGSESASSKYLPFSTWAFLSTTAFGIILIFYIDNIAEERLHMVFSSPRHLMVASGCIIIMEIVYQMDFSLLGFLVSALILGFGIHAATSLQRPKGDSLQKSGLSDAIFGDQLQMSPLPT